MSNITSKAFRIAEKKPAKITLGVILALSLLAAAVVPLYLIYTSRNQANAYLDGFDPGNIMSDFVMGNKNTMTEAQVNDFLHSKNPCNKAYDDEVKYWQGQGYIYGISGNRVLCMADDKFDGESAAHIIWQAAQDYSINPQVLIVLLEKEQSLVTDPWPNHRQYASATGFGCPDTGGCDPKGAGFKNQVRKAAALFREVLDGGWSNYPAYTTQFIYYNPNTGCGGTNIYIQNRATSALYRYTPYQPNAAALAAGTGTGDSCSSYGNRNFYNLFTKWFGDAKTVIQSNVDIPNGTYRLRAGDSDKFLDISGGGTANGANVQLWDYNVGDTVQDWHISKLSNGLYTLYNARSGKYLDVSGASTQSGANVQIWQNTGACAQQWAIVTNSNGYRLVSACSGKSLDIDGGNITNGTNVQIWNSNNSAAQRWYIDGLDANVPNGMYQLHASSEYLDIAGNSGSNGANVQLWELTGVSGQFWEITNIGNHLYTLRSPQSGKYLDVAAASTQSGANVQIWQNTGACAQKWYITTNGSGYRLQSACSGKSLDIAGGKLVNGTNVRIWDNNAAIAQQWQIDGLDANIPDSTYHLATGGKYLDIAANSTANGANVQLWEPTGAGGQEWQITNIGNNLYTLRNPQSGKYLDVAAASTKAGANVEIWENTGACAQKWYIQYNRDGYRLTSSCSGLSLDVADGNLINGGNAQIWGGNYTAAQRWYISVV